MQQYWVPQEDWGNEQIIIRSPDVHHMKHVMRFKSGDYVRVFDGQGRRADVEIVAFQDTRVVGRILRVEVQPMRQSWIICPALLKGEKMDWLMQKSTELGATHIYPLATDHAVVRLSPEKEVHRRMRFQKIVKEAAEQSARFWLPEVYPLYTLEEWLTKVWPDYKKQGGVLMVAASPQDAAMLEAKPVPLATLMSNVPKSRPYIVCVGPEGGFSEREMLLFDEHGAIMMTLGERPLRAETATLAILAYFLLNSDG
ncbi:MAG: RsmE family RNA methyltransferase [Candidatus Carbobacillus sp.]|nr:RsmE family RNA methyltransferase [Candidatus Carbobacillus sp.]